MEKLKDFLKENKELRVVILTGAGISAESGIKTFRESNGLWENHSIEDVATPHGFEKNSDLVYRFYNERRKQLLTSKPNDAHYALVEIENIFKKNYFLVTQNVDDLHDRAGSKNILHMHGELLKVRCLNCEKVYKWTDNLDSTNKCSSCTSGLRPHIVWFHEMPFSMDFISSQVAECNLFISIGTSGLVYPAAGFSQLAKSKNAFTLEINLQKTSGYFDDYLEGPATKETRRLLDLIKNFSKK